MDFIFKSQKEQVQAQKNLEKGGTQEKFGTVYLTVKGIEIMLTLFILVLVGFSVWSTTQASTSSLIISTGFSLFITLVVCGTVFVLLPHTVRMLVRRWAFQRGAYFFMFLMMAAVCIGVGCWTYSISTKGAPAAAAFYLKTTANAKIDSAQMASKAADQKQVADLLNQKNDQGKTYYIAIDAAKKFMDNSKGSEKIYEEQRNNVELKAKETSNMLSAFGGYAEIIVLICVLISEVFMKAAIADPTPSSQSNTNQNAGNNNGGQGLGNGGNGGSYTGNPNNGTPTSQIKRQIGFVHYNDDDNDNSLPPTIFVGTSTNPHLRICEHCQTEYTYKHIKQRFCSNDCRMKSHQFKLKSS